MDAPLPHRRVARLGEQGLPGAAPHRPQPAQLPVRAPAATGRLAPSLTRRALSLSVEEDAQHVARLAALLPTLPVIANLRCGLWYAPDASATAYFKVRPLSLPPAVMNQLHLVSF